MKRLVPRLIVALLTYVVVVLFSLGQPRTTLSPDPGFKPGVLPKSWVPGGPKCLRIPEFQIHKYNEDLYILRQSGCSNFELNEALAEMRGVLVNKVMRDFTISP